MKKVILAVTCLLLAAWTSGQAISEQYIPEVVKSKVKEMYPAAKGVYWKQPMPGFLDAYFNLNKQKCNATYQVSGAWVSTEFEIEAAEFPDSASQYLSKHADKIIRYYRSESKAKGTEYAADVKIADETMSFIFSQEGQFIMKGPKD